MVRPGVHLPNRRLHDGELTRILDVRALSYVLYVVWLEDLAYWVEIAAAILARYPGASLHVRIERRGILDAQADARVVTRVAEAFGARAATLRIRNEPQLESPGASPSEWRAYLVAFGQALSPELRRRVAVPAVSPGTEDWLSWLAASVDGALRGGLGILDVHAYGSPQEVAEVVGAHRQRWSGRLVCTEHNFGAGRRYDLHEYAAGLPLVFQVCEEAGVEAVCLFCWQWETPDLALPTTVDVQGTVVEEALAAAVGLFGVAEASPGEEDPDGQGGAKVSYESPNHGGPRKETRGIVVHSTRGGAATLDGEFRSAVAWLSDPRSEASAHAVVGPSGLVAYPVHPSNEAWHARAYNATHLGIELVQPRAGLLIPEETLANAARICARWCVAWNLPIRWDVERGLCEHREIAPGVAEGKTDVGPPFSRTLFLAAVKREARALAPQPRVEWSEVIELYRWGMARVANRQEPRSLVAFQEHLRALGCDSANPRRYGWPA